MLTGTDWMRDPTAEGPEICELVRVPVAGNRVKVTAQACFTAKSTRRSKPCSNGSAV